MEKKIGEQRFDLVCWLAGIIFLLASCCSWPCQARNSNNLSLYVNASNQPAGLNKTKTIKVPKNHPFMLTLIISGDNIDPKTCGKIELAGIETFITTNSTKGKTQLHGANGQNLDSYQFSYSLEPTEAGRFTIGPAECSIDNKIYHSNSVEVIVEEQVELKDFFATLEIVTSPQDTVASTDELDNLFVGQTAYAVIMLYLNQSELNGLDTIQTIAPDIPEIEVDCKKQEWRQEPIVQRGKKAYLVLKTVLKIVPLQAGQLILPPFKINSRIHQYAHGEGFFGMFMGSHRDVSVNTDDGRPRILQVKEIPPEAEAVGQNFNLKLQLSKTRFDLGEPINLSVDIGGKGDFDKIIHPELALPNNLKSYQSNSCSIKPTKKELVAGVEQIKRFEFILQPSEPGIYKIPPQKFCYFDNRKGELINVSSEPVSFCVMQDKDQPNKPPSQSSPNNGPESKSQNNAVNQTQKLPQLTQQLKTKLQQFGFREEYNPSNTNSFNGIGFGFLMLLFLLLLILIFIAEVWWWIRHKVNHNLALLKAKMALRQAEKTRNPRLAYEIILTFLANRFMLKSESLRLENLDDLIKFMDDADQQKQFIEFVGFAAAIAFGIEKLNLQAHEETTFFQQTKMWLITIDSAYSKYQKRS